MADTAQGVVLADAGRAEGRNGLARVRAEVVGCGYLVQLTAIDIPYGAAIVQSGDYAGGVGHLEQCIATFSTWRNKRMLAWAHLVLGEIYRGLAAKRPPMRVLARMLASSSARCRGRSAGRGNIWKRRCGSRKPPTRRDFSPRHWPVSVS